MDIKLAVTSKKCGMQLNDVVISGPWYPIDFECAMA